MGAHVEADDPFDLNERIELLISLRRYRTARKLAKQLIAINPDQSIGYTQLARCNLLLNLIPESVKAAKKGVSKEPQNAWAIYILAWAYLQANQLFDAEDCALDLLDFDPINVGARLILSYVYCATNRELQAANIVRTGLRFDPTDSELIRQYGSILIQRGEHYRALGVIARGMAIQPDSPYLHYDQGRAFSEIAETKWIWRALPDYHSAHPLFREAIRLDPTNADFRRAYFQNAIIPRMRLLKLPLIIMISMLALIYINLTLLGIWLLAICLVLVGHRIGFAIIPQGVYLTAPLPQSWVPPVELNDEERRWRWVWPVIGGVFVLEMIAIVLAIAILG